MAMNSVSIKAQFGDDIRKFSSESAASFEILQVKLRQLYERECSFVVKYVDEDGDRITVSSDIELAEALRLAKGLLRLSVVPTAAVCVAESGFVTVKIPWLARSEQLVRIPLPCPATAESVLAALRERSLATDAGCVVMFNRAPVSGDQTIPQGSTVVVRRFKEHGAKEWKKAHKCGRKAHKMLSDSDSVDFEAKFTRKLAKLDAKCTKLGLSQELSPDAAKVADEIQRSLGSGPVQERMQNLKLALRDRVQQSKDAFVPVIKGDASAEVKLAARKEFQQAKLSLFVVTLHLVRLLYRECAAGDASVARGLLLVLKQHGPAESDSEFKGKFARKLAKLDAKCAKLNLPQELTPDSEQLVSELQASLGDGNVRQRLKLLKNAMRVRAKQAKQETVAALKAASSEEAQSEIRQRFKQLKLTMFAASSHLVRRLYAELPTVDSDAAGKMSRLLKHQARAAAKAAGDGEKKRKWRKVKAADDDGDFSDSASDAERAEKQQSAYKAKFAKKMEKLSKKCSDHDVPQELDPEGAQLAEEMLRGLGDGPVKLRMKSLKQIVRARVQQAKEDIKAVLQSSAAVDVKSAARDKFKQVKLRLFSVCAKLVQRLHGEMTAGRPVDAVMARFVADATIPAGTVLSANSQFVKVWRLRNDGSQGWGDAVKLIHVGGDALGGAAGAAVHNVQPGETVDIQISLTAPALPGRYIGYWRLAAGGKRFGQRIACDVMVN
eukprot:TRINITY_DN7482_c0_g1_i1.p1 TRINITY_DN7482_c0_g1~~TRINITY_DN7482_c0_g1_i1.p1  ORF type:complete len:722 (-),score=233.51 TRINITY_DN7482_c0_g1_i1:107-2272(-)